MATSLQIAEAKRRVCRRVEKATLGIDSGVTVHLLRVALLYLC